MKTVMVRAGIILAILVVVLAMRGCLRAFTGASIVEAGEPIIRAIEQYHAAEGQYPDSLDQLDGQYNTDDWIYLLHRQPMGHGGAFYFSLSWKRDHWFLDEITYYSLDGRWAMH